MTIITIITITIITITIIISNIIIVIAAHGASCLHSSITSQRGLSSHLCCQYLSWIIVQVIIDIPLITL